MWQLLRSDADLALLVRCRGQRISAGEWRVGGWRDS